MAFDLKYVNAVDECTKIVISGFFRELSNDNCAIPQLVSVTTCLFYHIEADVEQIQISDSKALFSEMFETLDPDQNADLDEDEWICGLKSLGVNMQEQDMRKLFKLLDVDQDKFLDRSDWMTFCMTSYESPKMQRWQYLIASKVEPPRSYYTNCSKMSSREQRLMQELEKYKKENAALQKEVQIQRDLNDDLVEELENEHQQREQEQMKQERQMMNQEMQRLCSSKIKFAESAAAEIERLKNVIRVLESQNANASSSTQYIQRFLGYSA